jgi:ferredoxin--NADP+ reductase
VTFSPERPLRVVVIGAGPAGFYAAGALIGQTDIPVSVDILDRLPAPYGLVRYGIAPDHEKIRSVIRIYDKTASDERVRFFGNVEFGRDISREDLLEYYDQIIYAVGAQSDRDLGIPGEELPRSLSATAFVGWYNGHPDYSYLDIDLSIRSVCVVGLGNVAIDVARILARSVDELRTTDIADYALDALATSTVKDIYVLGRRGPAQAKFTTPEINEFTHLENADPVVYSPHLELDPASRASLEDSRTRRRNYEILTGFADRAPTGKPKRIHFLFYASPVEIIGDATTGVTGIRVELNELTPTESGYIQAVGTETYDTLEVDMVLRSVGYKGVPLPGVPYQLGKGTIPNHKGRIFDPTTGHIHPREYVAGWAKRGPSGVVGTNKADAVETVECLLQDAGEIAAIGDDNADPNAVNALLESRGVRYISFEDWQRVKEHEEKLGSEQGKPRVKFVETSNVLEFLGK